MKKSFFASLAGTLFGGVLLVAGLALGAALPLPGGGSGPQLGDPVTNLFTLTQAYTMGRGLASSSSLSVSQTATQAACTQLSQAPAFALVTVGTSAATGSVCLPTANSGNWVVIFNATGQTIDLFTSVTSFTPGTADNINTVAGSSAYTGLTTHKTAICYAPSNGNWACGSIS